MRIPFKKADLAVRLVFRYLLNCGREVVDSSVDDLACLRRHTDETPARFSSRLPSCGASRYKAPFPLLTKAQKQKTLVRLQLWQLHVFVSNFTGSAEWSSRRLADEKKFSVELPQNYFYQVVGG